MFQKRRVVPDTSVMLPAYFKEILSVGGRDFDLTRPGRRIANAILTREVAAFAPDLLLVEFTKRAFEKLSTRSGSAPLDPETVTRQVEDFFEGMLREIVW